MKAKRPLVGDKVLYRCRWDKDDVWTLYYIEGTGWGGSINLGYPKKNKGFFPCDQALESIIPYEGNESLVGTTDKPTVKYDILCVGPPCGSRIIKIIE